MRAYPPAPEGLYPALVLEFDTLARLALDEDLGGSGRQPGDVSTGAVFASQAGQGRIVAKAPAVVYGLWTTERLCAGRVAFEPLVADGQEVAAGTVLCRFRGPVAELLVLERTILNFLGFLSGIATRTRAFATLAAAHGTTRVVDTRKTLPGWRHLSKAAVRAGGGTNHRMGLYDMVMLKDNHIDAAGGMAAAVGAVRQAHGDRYALEVECRSLADVRQALALGVDVAMLDNMGPEDCARAVALRREEFPRAATVFEASGDMSLERLPLYAGLGLEYLSVGALTHSVTNANFSLGMEV